MAKSKSPRTHSRPRAVAPVSEVTAAEVVASQASGAASPALAAAEPNPVPVEERIRRRAYELYLERGSGPGRANDDWLLAESQIRSEQRQRTA